MANRTANYRSKREFQPGPVQQGSALYRLLYLAAARVAAKIQSEEISPSDEGIAVAKSGKKAAAEEGT